MAEEDIYHRLRRYLETASSDATDIELDLMEGHPKFGADHARLKHDVMPDDIRQVIYEGSAPEEKKSLHDPQRTLFWAAQYRDAN